MYPNLSYLLHDLIGTARDNGFAVVQMFGLLMGLAFLAAHLIWRAEFKRKEKEGILNYSYEEETEGKGADLMEVLTNGLFGLVLGLKLPMILTQFDTFKEDPPGFIFSAQGNWPIGILAALAFAGYTYWQGHKGKLETPKTVLRKVYPSDRMGDITVMAAIYGLIGARLFSILENLDSFFADPIGQLFSGSGLTIYGGLLLAFIMIYRYFKKKGIPTIHAMDAFAPAAIMGTLVVGRLGCQLSGDGDWGIVNQTPKPGWFPFPDWAWAYSYPHNVLNEGKKMADCAYQHCHELVPSVFPTPVYEIAAGLLIFGILWFLRKRVKWAGFIFFLYLMLQAVERFLIEFIRVNPLYDVVGMRLSQAQIISIVLFFAGAAGMAYWYRRRGEQIVMAGGEKV